MKFQPKTDREIYEENSIKDGTYIAEVFEANEFDSKGNKLLTKKGDEKIDLLLRLINEEGKFLFQKCTLTPAFIKILKRFCDATGLEDKYNNGGITEEDCRKVTKKFKVVIKNKSFKGNDGNEIYVSNITDILKLDEELNDDISF